MTRRGERPFVGPMRHNLGCYLLLARDRNFWGSEGPKISLAAFGASRDPRVGQTLGEECP